MPLTIKDAEALQIKLAKKVIKRDFINYSKIRYICGVDVSYRDDKAYACSVIVDRDLNVIDASCSVVKVEQPYIPGFLFLRESEPIFSALEKLDHGYDILMVDGHGLLHPRKFGLACYIGIKVNKPTVGVAKNLLCGKVSKSNAVLLNGRVVGYAIKTKTGAKPVYVSVGYKISLRTTVKIVKEVSMYRIPEPIRLADINSRRIVRGY
ncbi:MAG: endonuclease V [Nitrososphaerales archaeon]